MKRKFTEFIMAIIILSFAGTVFCDDFINKAEEAKETVVKIELGLKRYKMVNGVYPEDGNKNLLSSIHPEYTVFNLQKIKEGLFLDPWKRPYIYQRYDAGDNLRWHTYEIYSAGPNGVDEDGNGDDIGN